MYFFPLGCFWREQRRNKGSHLTWTHTVLSCEAHKQHTPITLVDKLQCSESENPTWLGVAVLMFEVIRFKRKKKQTLKHVCLSKAELSLLTTSTALHCRHLELCTSIWQYLPFPQSSALTHPYRIERRGISSNTTDLLQASPEHKWSGQPDQIL